jgi:hypothetical protein
VRLVGKATGVRDFGQAKCRVLHKFKRTLDSTSNDKLTWGAPEALLESMMKVRLAKPNIGSPPRDICSSSKISVD